MDDVLVTFLIDVAKYLTKVYFWLRFERVKYFMASKPWWQEHAVAACIKEAVRKQGKGRKWI